MIRATIFTHFVKIPGYCLLMNYRNFTNALLKVSLKQK